MSPVKREVRRHRSIAARIVVLVTVASCIFLGAFGLVLDRWFRNYRANEHKQFIVSRLYFIRSELDTVGGEGRTEEHELHEIQQLIERENRSPHLGNFFARVTDRRGMILMSTAGMEEIDRERPPLPAPQRVLDDASLRYWKNKAGRYYVLSAITLPVAGNPRHVAVALDRSGEEHQIAEFRLKSIIALLLGTMASAFSAAWIARKTLAPLNELAARASSLDASNMNQDFAGDHYPAEVKSLADALSNMQSRLSGSFERLGQFSADLAHELRTPVSNLMGETEVVLRSNRDGAEYRAVLESSMEELSRLARIIDSLLFLARAERGSQPAELAKIDLGEEAEAVVDFHRAAADEKGIGITCSGHAEVMADQNLLRRAISNLLANAIQYTPAGGRVDITVSESDANGRIEVHDSGGGIPPEQRTRVFDRFFRGDQARSAYSEGSGLGLSIVKSIVDLHKGDIRIDGDSRGTIVTMTLPAPR